MGMPDIGTGPAQVFGILPRPAPEPGQGPGDILVIFRKMGMKHDPLVPRQQGRFAHQIAADGKGRAGCKTDPYHRAIARIVEGIDHADAVFKDRGLAFHQIVRRQSARAFPDAHRAACRVKAQAHLGCGRDGVIQP